MREVVASRADAAAETGVGGHLPETLLPDLEEFGLNGSQARALLALLQLGSGSSSEIARLAELPRTAVYPVLQDLEAKRLIARVGSEGPTFWASAGRDEVLRRLDAVHEERLRQQQARVSRVRATLEELVPAGSGGTMPLVHVLTGPARAKDAYDQLLARTTSELLVFARPPYPAPPGPMNPTLLTLLDRGVLVRVLFQPIHPGEGDRRGDEQQAYDLAGVESRVVDELPVKLVVSDRRAVLVAIPDGTTPDTGFPTSLLVENGNYASLHVAVFETFWEKAALR